MSTLLACDWQQHHQSPTAQSQYCIAYQYKNAGHGSWAACVELAKADLAKASAGGLLLKERRKSPEQGPRQVDKSTDFEDVVVEPEREVKKTPLERTCVSPCVPGHTTQQVCLPWTGSPPVCVAGAQQWFGARLSHSGAVSHYPTARLARRQSLLRWLKQHPERRTRRRKRVNRQKVLLESIMSTTLRNPRTLWRRPQKQWHQQREQQSQRHHPPRRRKQTLARHRQCQHQVPRGTNRREDLYNSLLATALKTVAGLERWRTDTRGSEKAFFRSNGGSEGGSNRKRVYVSNLLKETRMCI